jgi:inosine-uridine nucleoside N-ribohydrolase
MLKRALLVFISIALVAGGLLLSVSAQETDVPPIPFIIDTDMALDDWLAILYVTQSPQADLRAVSVTGTGEAHCNPGVSNALGLLELADLPDVPVACGRETPLMGHNSFPAWLRDWVDSMAELELPENSNLPYDGTAVELLISTILESPEPVTLLTLGPLTNVAEAIEAEPAIIDHIGMIYIMGGAVDVPGNIGFITPLNTVAEANIYVDPHAAGIVFDSGAAITLVPLDATNHAPVTEDFVKRLEEDRTTPQAEFVFQALGQASDFIQSGGYFFWDPLAAGIAVDETLVMIEERNLIVVEEEGSSNGQTREDEDGALIRMAVSADGDRFETEFLNVLNGR